MGTGFFLAIRPIAPPTHRTRSRSQCSGSKTPSDNSFGYKFGLCVPPSYNLFPTLSRSAVAEGCDTHRNTSARCPEAQRRYHRESPLILFAILVWFQIAPFSRPECLDSANVRTNTLAYIPTLVAQNLLNIVAESAGRSGVARVGLINRAVDLAISPISDEAQWGVVDHWSSPFETLQTHRGDCEDYAIVKYVALLQAGLSHNDVKIVILRNLLPKEDHAVVAARVDGQWLILDNRRLALVRDTKMVGSIPKFVLDEDGTRRFVLSNRAGQGPSADRSSMARIARPASARSQRMWS
jgi:predicted transglutaminase-like cysteine proteinase